MAAKKRSNGSMDRRGQSSGSDAVPRWDETLRELRLGRLLIKRFRQPAPIQELIISRFQATGWPRSIASPLAPSPLHDAGVHLRDAAKCLNRAQRPPGIRFHVNHRSTIIYWTVEEDADANNRPPKPRKAQGKRKKTRKPSRSADSALRAPFDKGGRRT